MTLWETMRRILGAAQDSFETVMSTISGLASGEPLGGPLDDEDPRKLRTLGQQVAFTIGVIGLGAKMAKADGTVTPEEVDAFREVFHIPPGEERNVRRVFDMARQDVAGFEGYAKQIARLFRGRPGVLEDLLDGLFHIALADGEVHPKEITFLERVADIFGFAPNEFERIRCSHMGCPNADPYGILGVERGASDSDIKRAYRYLVRENHPDAMIARGVPEEFVTLANQKLAIINRAYESIREQRARVTA